MANLTCVKLHKNIKYSFDLNLSEKCTATEKQVLEKHSELQLTEICHPKKMLCSQDLKKAQAFKHEVQPM